MADLRSCFPMLRTREEILALIEENQSLKRQYLMWKPEQREEFLAFCTGIKGARLLYDSFFKEIFNPEYNPQRLERMLSSLIGESIRILSVLPNDSTRIADESSLLITDIVVELSDGSIANVEIQKIGYRFPGERAACYSSDLLLRQYRRLRDEKKKAFSYKDIKSVYTIVIFESSPKEFKELKEEYIHHFEQTANTGLRLNLLQKYIFISLDNFKENHQNRNIESERDAWLTFMSFDEPEMVMLLIERYPEFRELYEQVYDICRNVERVMEMYSKELQELDRNTVQYMIDEMQDELDALNVQYKELDVQCKELDVQCKELDVQCKELDVQCRELNEQCEELNIQNEKQKDIIMQKDEEIRRLRQALAKLS